MTLARMELAVSYSSKSDSPVATVLGIAAFVAIAGFVLYKRRGRPRYALDAAIIGAIVGFVIVMAVSRTDW